MSQPGYRIFFTSLLKITRFWNLFVIAIAQVFTAVFLIDEKTLSDLHLYAACLSTVLIAAGGYIINDYYDVKIDYINKPQRVVVGRSITRRIAIFFHVLFSSAGVLLGLYLSPWIGLVNACCVLLLWSYSNYLKRLPLAGNLAIAILTGASIVLIDLLYMTAHKSVVAYAVFAFFMTLIREVIKDMEDVQGDQQFGSMTVPIVLGMRRTKVLLYLLMAAFLVTAFVLNARWHTLPLVILVVVLPLPLAVLSLGLYKADTVKAFSRLSGWCKYIMLLGVLSMVYA